MSWLPNDVVVEGEIKKDPVSETHDDAPSGFHDNHNEESYDQEEKHHEGEDGSANGGQHEEAKQEDFDVAEEDEGRWMAE